MSGNRSGRRNWFDQGGANYAAFRPQYPAALAAYLASLPKAHRLALDVGCGSGQLTSLLAEHFAEVIGADPSADQLCHAKPHPNVRYLVAPAEALPLPDRSVDLIVAAQAAHWFDLPKFYAEVRRLSQPGGVVALLSYGVLHLEPDLDARFQHFYAEEIGPFWSAERKLVDSGYATMAFPFVETMAPALEIRLEWNLAAFLGYLSTWSAVRNAREAGRADVLQAFADDLAARWGAPEHRRPIVWPINMRVGSI